MKCPYCGREMDDGTLRSRGSSYFLPDGKPPAKIAFYTKGYLEKANAVPLPPFPYEVSRETEWPRACCCRDCRKIILSYETYE